MSRTVEDTSKNMDRKPCPGAVLNVFQIECFKENRKEIEFRENIKK